MVKRALLICLPWLISGCSGLWGTQSPAPVFSGGEQQRISKSAQIVHPQPSTGADANSANSSAGGTGTVVKTKPLGDSQAPSATPFETAPSEQILPANPESQVPGTQNQLEPELQQVPTIPKVDALPALETLEPFKASTPLSPAVGSLLASAEKSSYSGSLDSAAASIERAIRIEPRNATLLYKLAEIRMKQSNPRLAEDLAKKAMLLSGKDNRLKKQCWLLISNAKIMQNDATGAKEARANAAKF